MSALTKEEKDHLLKQLESLTKDMDVPSFRRTSVPWLSRNLAIRNADHKNHKEAAEILEKLSKAGVQ